MRVHIFLKDRRELVEETLGKDVISTTLTSSTIDITRVDSYLVPTWESEERSLKIPIEVAVAALHEKYFEVCESANMIWDARKSTIHATFTYGSRDNFLCIECKEKGWEINDLQYPHAEILNLPWVLTRGKKAIQVSVEESAKEDLMAAALVRHVNIFKSSLRMANSLDTRLPVPYAPPGPLTKRWGELCFQMRGTRYDGREGTLVAGHHLAKKILEYCQLVGINI